MLRVFIFQLRTVKVWKKAMPVCVSMGKQVIVVGLWGLSQLCCCLSSRSILTKPGIPTPFCHGDLSRRPGLISSKNALVKIQSDSNNSRKRIRLTWGTLLLGSRSANLMGCQWKEGGWAQLISQTVGCRQKEGEVTLFLWKSLLALACYRCCRVCASKLQYWVRVGCWIPGKNLSVIIWISCPNVDNSHL